MWYENNTLMGDTWSLYVWTARHLIRHHISKMEGLQRRLFVRGLHHQILPRRAHVYDNERRRRCDELLNNVCTATWSMVQIKEGNC